MHRKRMGGGGCCGRTNWRSQVIIKEKRIFLNPVHKHYYIRDFFGYHVGFNSLPRKQCFAAFNTIGTSLYMPISGLGLSMGHFVYKALHWNYWWALQYMAKATGILHCPDIWRNSQIYFV